MSKQVIIIEAKREGYSIEQAENEREAITVGELMQLLEDFDEDTKVYISNDNGYTYLTCPVRQHITEIKPKAWGLAA